MADKDELFYKPNIPEPIRERDETPDPIVEERAYQAQMAAKIAAETGILPEDRPDPLTAYELKFQNYQTIAEEIKARATFLLDKTIEDLDLYVGDAPIHILELITDLTDISFVDANNNLKPPTDPVYTIPFPVAKCIFTLAGAYAPRYQEKDLMASAKTFDSAGFKKKVQKTLTQGSYMNALLYGLELLLIVLKLAHVISVHYTVGYICGALRKMNVVSIKITFKISKWKKTIKWEYSLAKKIFAPIEEKLLGLPLINYKCKKKGAPLPRCDAEGWRKINFKEVNCCTLEPINFGGSEGKPQDFIQVACFKRIVRAEMDPNYSGKRTICSYVNADKEKDLLKDVTDYERTAASEVAKYLGSRGSVTGVMDPQNIPALSKSIEAADAGVEMTQSVQSSLNNNRSYVHTGEKTEPWDCFGMTDSDQRSPEERMMAAINNAAGTWLPKNGVPIEGESYFQFLGALDSVIGSVLAFADKTVSGVANLARWGSSKQLCCFVYLLTAFATIWHSLIKHGQFCPDMDAAAAFRNEMRWAYNLRNNKDMKQLTKLLQVMKQIVDIFVNKMKRQIMITGFVLPLGEMWEMIKLTVSNGLSEFLDILFGPLDKVLAGMQTIPEIRHMINNECFGFGQFMKFLLCLLGNLKWGLINNIMKLLDFALPDMVLLQDIMLTRMRLKSLESLSKLLGALINLILGLKDCYDPTQLPGQIVQQELKNEYSNAQNLVNLMGTPNNLATLDIYCQPIMSDSVMMFTPDEQNAIDQRPGGLARQFGEFGPAAREIADNVIGGKNLAVANFVDPKTGEIVSFGEFTTMMENMTGTRVSEIEESMRYIFDILRGYSDDKTV